jgi:cytochrome P450 family 4
VSLKSHCGSIRQCHITGAVFRRIVPQASIQIYPRNSRVFYFLFFFLNLLGKHKLVTGQTATILAFMIHRDEKYFPNAEKFDPDRFLPENSKNRHPYAYIPFSAGRRNCIGQRFAQMELKCMFAHLLRKFEIKSLKTIEEIHPEGDLILRPKNGIPVQLKFRS